MIYQTSNNNYIQSMDTFNGNKNVNSCERNILFVNSFIETKKKDNELLCS